jgi:hypothetical protein
MIITGLGDRMAPPDHAVMLRQHRDRCALHWFPGSQVLHMSQLHYLRRMTSFLHGRMFDWQSAVPDVPPPDGWASAAASASRRAHPCARQAVVWTTDPMPPALAGGFRVAASIPPTAPSPAAEYRCKTHTRPQSCCGFPSQGLRSPAPCTSRAPDTTGSRPTSQVTRCPRGLGMPQRNPSGPAALRATSRGRSE